jgi:hypothetical protein
MTVEDQYSDEKLEEIFEDLKDNNIVDKDLTRLFSVYMEKISDGKPDEVDEVVFEIARYILSNHKKYNSNRVGTCIDFYSSLFNSPINFLDEEDVEILFNITEKVCLSNSSSLLNNISENYKNLFNNPEDRYIHKLAWINSREDGSYYVRRAVSNHIDIYMNLERSEHIECKFDEEVFRNAIDRFEKDDKFQRNVLIFIEKAIDERDVSEEFINVDYLKKSISKDRYRYFSMTCDILRKLEDTNINSDYNKEILEYYIKNGDFDNLSSYENLEEIEELYSKYFDHSLQDAVTSQSLVS